MSLRKGLIRLAWERPELRPDILPLVRRASDDLYVPFTDMPQKPGVDGWRIDGAKVRFWANKRDAQQAAAAIGWPKNTVTKVHTRFQIGWALADGRFGLLSREGYGKLYYDRNDA